MNTRDRALLRAESLCDDSTIRRWARGERVQDVTRERLARAAKAVGVPIPERADVAKASGG